MSPIRNRRSGRGFHGGTDTERIDRFQPGVRGPEFPPPEWTVGINFSITSNSSSASGMSVGAKSYAIGWRLSPDG